MQQLDSVFHIRILQEVTVCLMAANCSFCFLSYFVQYQNVFAPLIKLEADYDKVCLLIIGIVNSFIKMLYCIFLKLFSLYEYHAASYCLNFLIDDERISKQGQCHDSMGYRS